MIAVVVMIVVAVMMIKVEQVEQIPDGWHVPRNVDIVVIKAWIR